MTRVMKNNGKLEEWILVEAYRNGLARRGGICSAEMDDAESPDGYDISRYAVYQRYFNLPIEAFFRGGEGSARARRSASSRLRCSALLCESVRTLLRAGLIRFPRRAPVEAGAADTQAFSTTCIGLTAAGMRMAESLLRLQRDPKARVNGGDPGWVLTMS